MYSVLQDRFKGARTVFVSNCKYGCHHPSDVHVCSHVNMIIYIYRNPEETHEDSVSTVRIASIVEDPGMHIVEHLELCIGRHLASKFGVLVLQA